MLGVVVCAVGCVKPSVISIEPTLCPPYTLEILDEHDALAELDRIQVEHGGPPVSPRLRAWVREAEKACRANEEIVYGDD